MKDLKKANELIKVIAREHKEITPITLKDIPLFEKFFKKEPHTYGNSWTYVTQGMYGIGPFGLGYKYYDGKNLSAVAIYPKIEQPNIYCFYWVRPMGPQIIDIINKFSNDLLKNKNIPTYVKKIFKEQFLQLQENNFKDTLKLPWHSLCPSEDDSLPELIIDLDKLLNDLKNNVTSKRLRKIIKMNNIFSNKFKPEFVNLIQKKRLSVWKMTTEFFTYRRQLKDSFMISTEYDFYNMLFHPSSDNNRIAKMVIINGKIVGFYNIEKQQNKYAGLYGVILLRNDYKNITEFVMMKIFSDLHNKGIRYINLGGSEYKGVQDAKLKYHPTISQQMYWASLY